MHRILVALLVLACSPVAAAHASPVVRGSVEQVQVTGAKPGQKLILKRHGDGRAGEDEQHDQDPIHGAALNRVSPGLSIAGSLAPWRSSRTPMRAWAGA